MGQAQLAGLSLASPPSAGSVRSDTALNSYGPYSYRLHSHSLYSYGLSAGVRVSVPRPRVLPQFCAMVYTLLAPRSYAYIVMAHIVMARTVNANISMAYTVMAYVVMAQ